MQDQEHRSNTAYDADNYTLDSTHPEWSPRGWTHLIRGHACYDPAKVPACGPLTACLAPNQHAAGRVLLQGLACSAEPGAGGWIWDGGTQPATLAARAALPGVWQAARSAC